MTSSRRSWWRASWRGTLRSWLVAAFVLVAVSSVGVLTVAALIGSDRGLSSARLAEREATAQRVAEAAGAAYRAAAGWAEADLSGAESVAEAAGARLVLRDVDGRMVSPGRGMGPGGGQRGTSNPADAVVGAHVVDEPVLADGEEVGSVRLVFDEAVAGGRAVAWTWVAGAAVLALVLALAVSGYVTRRLTRPLAALTIATRRFAAGQRSARAGTGGPGELGELARAFDGMADEVMRVENVRRQLAADVAHELRTPLAALQAGLEELRDGLAEPDPRRLAGLHDQTLRLGRVVQDLAELSSAEAAAVSLRLVPAELTEVVRGVVDAARPQLTAAGLAVSTDLAVPVTVLADRDRLHQAVANLLSNAVRYCSAGDQVRVLVRVEAETASIEVADTGPGIPSGELPHVFDRLWRGSAATAVAGSGIGLAVVRELVAAHGGTVSVTSPPTGGATFEIHLPTVGRWVSPPADRRGELTG